MNINEQNDFFESEPVKRLLSEARKEGYIYMRTYDFELKSEDALSDLCKMNDRCFIEHLYIKRACQFIDDVVNDRFDLHTLDDTKFQHMYKYFVANEHNTLLRKIKEYCKDAYDATIYTLPDYFTIKPELCYCLECMTPKEAYAKLCDVIDVAKIYTLLYRSCAAEVFYSKLMLEANERETIKELDA